MYINIYKKKIKNMSIINGVGRVGIRNYVSPITISYLLDTYGGAATAYSLRKLSSTYAGFAIRVRRSSDNAEQNIGFDGSGNLDTTALLSFVGSGNGFVTTWYDQSGNEKNATQPIAANQPSIVTSGVISTLNGKNSIIFNSGKFLSKINANIPVNQRTNFFVFKMNSQIPDGRIFSLWNGSGQDFNKTSGFVLQEGNPGRNEEISLNGSTSQNYQLIFGSRSTITPQSIVTETLSGTTGSIYKNGVLKATDTSFTAFDTTPVNNLYINNGQTDTMGDTTFQELLLWGTDNSTNASNITTAINSYYSIYPTYTSRTTAFAAATGITDTTILNALNTFDTGLISNGLDTKMKALYPFVGGTSATHKFNFMDARDTDAAFRLQFNGGWVHSSTGAKPNGTNAYANTYLSPYTQLLVGSRHLSMYASDNSQANQYSIDMGSYDSSGSKSTMLSIQRTADNVIGQLNNWGNQSLTSGNNSKGLLIINRPSISSSKAFKNNVLIASTTNDITGQIMPNFNIFLGNSNDNGTAGGSVMSSRGFSLSSIGYGLSDSEASTFYNLVQALQTSLGRQV